MNLGGFTATRWPANANTLKPLNTSYYFGFTIDEDVGITISLTQISFGSTTSGNGIREFALRSSLDGFTQNIAMRAQSNDGNTHLQLLGLDSRFSNLTDPVTFRLYGYEALSDMGGWSISDLKVSGDVVPEPSASILTAIAGILFLTYRTRKSKCGISHATSSPK